MKRITISVIVMISMLLTSCGNISEKDNAANTSAEVTTTTVAEDTSSVTTTSETEETSEAVTTTTRTEKDDSSSQAETTAATTSKKSTTTSKKSSGKVKVTSSGRTGSSNNSNNGGGYSGGGNVVTQAPAQQQAAPTQTTTTTQPPVKKTTTTTTTQYIPEPEPIPEPVAPNTSIVDIDMTDDQMYVFLTLYPIDYEGMYQAGQNLSYDGTNYGKAKAVCEYAYNCGGRNCIEYALNAYFVAQGAGLECYLARSSQYDWYGHVANIVNIDGQYYYMEPMTNETTANTAIAFGGYRADGSGIIDPVPLDIFFDIYDNRYSLDVSSSKYGE